MLSYGAVLLRSGSSKSLPLKKVLVGDFGRTAALSILSYGVLTTIEMYASLCGRSTM